jgi:hypothetical protein
MSCLSFLDRLIWCVVGWCQPILMDINPQHFTVSTTDNVRLDGLWEKLFRDCIAEWPGVAARLNRLILRATTSGRHVALASLELLEPQIPRDSHHRPLQRDDYEEHVTKPDSDIDWVRADQGSAAVNP